MRNRNTNSKDSKSSRSSGDSQKTFRRASGKPEAESRFSKPSIKKSSLRAATASPSDKPASFRPRAFGKDSGPRDFKPAGRDGQDKPAFDKPGFDKPRFDRPRFDKPGIGKPRFTDSDNREFKPREGASSERPRSFDNDRDSRSFKPRTDSDSSERPRRSDSDRTRSFERPQEGRSFKPRTDSDSSERPRRSDSDRTRSFERPQEGRSFKPRTDSDSSERPRRSDSDRNRSFERPQEGRSFKPRTDSDSSERPRRSDSDKPSFDKPRTFGRDGGSRDFKPSAGRSEKPSFKKKDESDRLEENNTQEISNADEGANRRVGRFETAPYYKLGTYEKKAGIKKRNDENSELRLNRYIANAGICSRREADELIAAGEISVNGKVVTEMGHKVLKTDVVKYGKKLLNPEKMVYVLINKPKDYITTTDDPEERKTVLDLIKGACSERIYPVGRLDRNTTGLLLMTNDGALAKKLTHPSGNVKKIYQAELDKAITTEDFEKLQHGLELEDGFIRPDEVGIVTADAMVVGLEIHSGHNRIVRRMFEHLGYEVQKLDRTVFAGLDKKDLPRGKWRFLSEKEVIKLKYML